MSDRIYLYTDGRDDSCADVSMKEHGTPEATAMAIHCPGPFKAYSNDPDIMLRFVEALESEESWLRCHDFWVIKVDGIRRLVHPPIETCRRVLTRAKERRKV